MSGRSLVWLDNARILAVFAVIMVHVAHVAVNECVFGTSSWWIGNIYVSIAKWPVPIFVMISGALLLDPSKTEKLRDFYKKRLSRILYPMVVWSVFYLLWACLKDVLKGIEPDIPYLLQIWLQGKPAYHMWFLYMIIFLYLFVPFFRKVVVRSTMKELTFLVSIMFVLSAFHCVYQVFYSGNTGPFPTWFLMYLPYFFLGHIIRSIEIRISRRVLILIFSFSAVLTAAGCFWVAEHTNLQKGLYFYKHLSITIIPLSASLMCLLKQLDKPLINESAMKQVVVLAFGVYLLHPFVQDIVKFLGFDFMSMNLLVSIPVASVLVFAVSLIGAWVIKRIPYLRRAI